MHEGHRERLKNRFLVDGLDSFEQHQILEMLLFYAIPRKDTNELAHVLINKYGSLSGVLEADPKDLATIKGMSMNSAILLSLMPSLFRVYTKDRYGNKPMINSSKKAGEYACSLLLGRPYEIFYVICLDAQSKVNFAALVHEGSINEAIVYPRIVVETALRHKANSVILAHNHPGGSLKPSNADVSITLKIIEALNAISIKVVDHIIVAGDSYTSFAELGLIQL